MLVKTTKDRMYPTRKNTSYDSVVFKAYATCWAGKVASTYYSEVIGKDKSIFNVVRTNASQNY